MTMIGSNPDELDALAETFGRAGGELLEIHTEVLRLVRQSPWDGRDAEQFEAHWRQRSRSGFDQAGAVLARAAQALRRNAEEQRRASSADGAWSTGSGSGGGSDGTGDPGDLGAITGATPAEQLAWWNSLTPAEQAALLARKPGGLLALEGLPDDVRAEANQRAAGLTNTIASVTDAYKVEAGVNVKLVSIGAEGEAVITTFADGHVEVSIGGELAVGVGPKGTEDLRAEIRATGKAVATWSFDTQQEANAFLRGLLEAPYPDDYGDWFHAGTSLVPGIGGASYMSSEVTEYLQGQSDHYKSTVVGGELSGDIKLGFPGVGDVEVHGGVGVEYDTAEKTTTAFIEVSAEGSLAMSPWAGAAAGEDRLSVTWGEDGSIESMSLKGTYSAQAGLGLDTPIELSSLAGTGGSFEIKLNLSDPANQALALDLLQGAATGDARLAASAYNGLFDSSQIVVQSNVVTSTEFGVDVVVANAGGSGESTSSTQTFVKPSHGDFVEVKP